MAKKIAANQKPQVEAKPIAASAPKPPRDNAFSIQAIVLALLGLVLYFNTLNHEYAFDDMMAIVDNDYVQQGVSGIPKIFSTDAFESYLEHKNGSNQLSGGRYRPLSLVTFAIEQQLLGINDNEDATAKEAKLVADMHFRHGVNVLLYILLVTVLLKFLRTVVFADHPAAAFFAALLFLVHPLHTEVVANVKSRDEILSLLFILLTLQSVWKYRGTSGIKGAWRAGVFFFLALLSKEYAVTMLLLLPVFDCVFCGRTVVQAFKRLLPMLAPFGLYLLMRLSAVTDAGAGAENNIMNYPYLFATGSQALASKILVLLQYLKLLVFPHPMVADYSYNQIPYSDFSNPLVWASLLVYLGMGVGFFAAFGKRSPIAFAIACYLLPLLLVSNLLRNIGAPMGERLVFHSSLGFCIAIAAAAAWLLERGQPKEGIITGFARFMGGKGQGAVGYVAVMAVVALPAGYATIGRNADWKNNNTLFLHDVQSAPNSVLVNNDAAAACMSMAKATHDTAERRMWFGRAEGYFTHAIALYPRYTLAYLNRGLCYFNSGIPDSALRDWDSVRVQSHDLPNLAKYTTILGKYYVSQAMGMMRGNQPDAAQATFAKAAEASPDAPGVWFNWGMACANTGRRDEALRYLERAQKLDPNSQEIANALQSLRN